MVKSAPTVSVNMCVYNAEKYLREAVDSILSQTFLDFEFIIVDDGSTDGSACILAGYSDPRIRVFAQANQGIPGARNRALERSRGRYIAVMDADDVSLPERLERQVAFLDAHSEVGVLGTAARFLDELAGREWDYWPPIEAEQVHRQLVQGNPLVHTSVMIRRSILETVGGYDEAYPYYSDYELFVRLAPHTCLANLPEVLVLHRHHLGSASTALRTEPLRLWLRIRIHYKAFRTLGYPFHCFWYVLKPVLYALLELPPKLKCYMRESTHSRTNGNGFQDWGAFIL